MYGKENMTGTDDQVLLLTGTEYEELPDSFVIFICDFDPFGGGKYQYTVRMRLEEMPEAEYEDRADHIVEVICQNKAKGRTVAEIAEFLSEDVDEIAAIYETCDTANVETKEEQ